MSGLRTVTRAAFESVENLFDRAFGPELNPMHQLGALGWFFYWIVIVSGVYLYSVQSDDDRFEDFVGKFVVVR